MHIDDMDIDVEAYAAGKMKRFNIKIIPGDLVKVELNTYEPTKGRITYRTIQKPTRRRKVSEVVSVDDVVGNPPPTTQEETPKV